MLPIRSSALRRGVPDVALGVERAGDDAEVGEPADERIGGRLEDLGHERARPDRARSACRRSVTRPPTSAADGTCLAIIVDQLADPDVLQRAAHEDRDHAALARALVDAPSRSPRR